MFNIFSKIKNKLFQKELLVDLAAIDFTKKVYLTIDDSPSAFFLDKIDYLEKKKIPAILFCIGQLMEQRSSEMVESIQRGFHIANHSYSHPHFSKIDLQQCKYEIEKTDTIINELYEKAGVKRTQKWFRFPYGDKGDMKHGVVFQDKKPDLERKEFIQHKLLELGYVQPSWEGVHYDFMNKAGLLEDLDSSWTYDIMEWALLEKKPTMGLSNVEKLLERLRQLHPNDCRGDLKNERHWLASPSAEIILLYDHEETTEAFYKIVDELLEFPLEFFEVY